MGFPNEGVHNNSSFRPTRYFSARSPDTPQDRAASSSKSSAAPNIAIGFFMPNVGGIRTAVEVEFTYLNSEVTIQGLPGLVGFPTAANDSLTIKKEWMLTLAGLMYMPYEPFRSWYLKAGLALMQERFVYNCLAAGFCGVAPSTPAFSSSDTKIALGAILGLGYEFELAMLSRGNNRAFARIGYDHIFVPSYDVSAGTDATRSVGGRVSNDVDRLYLQLAMSLSDSRLKRDIVRVGELDSGIPLYRYKYPGSETDFVGVMAQEVALLKPAAVVHGHDGYLRVNYAKLGSRLMTWQEWQASR